MNNKFYWDLSDLPAFVKRELDRRTDSINGNIVYVTGGNKNSFRPSTAFIRVCSNAIVKGKQGFVLGGLKNSGFSDTYGFNSLKSTILGYDCDGGQHYIKEEKFKHRANPGITEIDTELSGGDGKFRITTIKWVCWSREQLEYMTPYFLTNGVSMSIEFGWNIVDPASLLPISNASEMVTYFKNDSEQKNIIELVKKSNGNYDASMGVISDFNYSVRADGGFDCTTTVKNVGGFFSGVFSGTRTTEDTSNPNSKQEELKTFIKKIFNSIPNEAKLAHKSGVKRDRRGNIIKGDRLIEDSVIKEVFYARDNSEVERIKKQGSPKNYDFDNSKDVWWISFRYLIDILNSKCALKMSNGGDIFKFDIENTVISAHPNLISNDGGVLLVPNSSAPQLLFQSSTENRIDSIGDQEDLRDANEILKNQKKKFLKNVTDKGESVYITRVDLNEIINWWSVDISNRSFPANIEDDVIKKRRYYGYLKNLYVNKNVVIEAVENHHTYKDIILFILDKMNSAVGNIWKFEIVPLKPDGNENGVLTIIDRDCSNGFLPKDIYDFKFSQVKGILKEIQFSVKSTDSVTVQTLFGNSRKETSQDVSQPINYPEIEDRILKSLESSNATKVEDFSNSLNINDRIPSKESNRFYFYTKKNGITYCLVEPVQSIQMDLLNTKEDNPLRYSAVQPGITLDIKISGISGIVNLHTFTVSELPFPYGKRCFFQVQNVKHLVSNGTWITNLTAGIRLKPEYYGK